MLISVPTVVELWSGNVENVESFLTQDEAVEFFRETLSDYFNDSGGDYTEKDLENAVIAEKFNDGAYYLGIHTAQIYVTL